MELSLPLSLPRALAPAGRRRPAGRPAFRSLGANLLRARSRALRVCLCLALALPPLGGAWLWLRGSPLVAIRHVQIAGVHGPEAIEIRSALDRAARAMTTMRFDPAALRAAVADYPIVASIQARTSFPHGLLIDVTERDPVAVLVAPGQRSALAADGTVLGPALASSSLPTLAAAKIPAPGRTLGEAGPLAAATVLGAAPAALLGYVARVYEGPEGLTAQMRNGLLVYFGDASLPHAKWLSLARVLSSPDAAGAVYVDVRLPSRPAAGFTLSAVAAHASASAASRIGGADPTAAALAERLVQGTAASTAAGTTAGEEERQGASGGTAASGASESERSSPSGAGGAAAEPGSAASVEHTAAATGEGHGGAGEPAAAGGTQAPGQASSSG